MPKKAQPVPPNETVNIVIRTPGWFKNQLIEHCNNHNTDLNPWIHQVLRRALREAWGLPPEPQAKYPAPTINDEIRAYVTGERLVAPCGRLLGECGFVSEGFGGLVFCGVCGVRV